MLAGGRSQGRLSGAVSGSVAHHFSPDGRLFGQLDGVRNLVVWELRGDRHLQIRNIHENTCIAFVFTGDGKYLLSGSGVQKVGEQATPQGDLLLSSPALAHLEDDFIGEIKVWDTGTGELVEKFSDPRLGLVTALVMEASGRAVLVGDAKGRLGVFTFDGRNRR
jgi:hypothetical protein